ncbi:MAG: hypothetical protein JXR42_01105 [Gammaproteobacteria bacterium]|nr:hypothetical protein [Gammaproteobacteria bacterium]
MLEITTPNLIAIGKQAYRKFKIKNTSTPTEYKKFLPTKGFIKGWSDLEKQSVEYGVIFNDHKK